MKKILLIAAVAGMAMVSCKKDRTCSCTETSTTTNNSVTVSSSQNVDVVFTKQTKRIAKLACVHTKSTDTNNNTTHTTETNCTLK
ncbi:MAG: hypothetical protein ACXVNO_10840 [Bacteroidia bacterium]